LPALLEHQHPLRVGVGRVGQQGCNGSALGFGFFHVLLLDAFVAVELCKREKEASSELSRRLGGQR